MRKARLAALFSERRFIEQLFRVKLQVMNERFRLPIAVLVSLLLHIAVLVWVMQLVKVRSPDGQGLLQVFLQNDVRTSDRPIQFQGDTAPPALKNPQPKPVQTPTDIPKLPRSITGGHFHAPPYPAVQQAEQMNAMRLAQLAQQREAERAAVMTGMTNLAAQLRPLISTSLVCAQQTKNEIDCTPAPEDKLRPLLKQFFNLAIQARRLGVAGNPVRMDFGPELGVSVTLQP